MERETLKDRQQEDRLFVETKANYLKSESIF